MKTFDISLKNEKEGTYRLIILFLAILHVIYFIYLLMMGQYEEGIAGFVIIVLYCGYRLLITNVRKEKFSLGSGFFYFFTIIFPFIGWISWLDMIPGVLSQLALQHINFHFEKSYVERRNFPWKKYNWTDFDNVVLKDQILTLDFKNNKLLQAEIDQNNINEEAFNIFAKEALNK